MKDEKESTLTCMLQAWGIERILPFQAQNVIFNCCVIFRLLEKPRIDAIQNLKLNIVFLLACDGDNNHSICISPSFSPYRLVLSSWKVCQMWLQLLSSPAYFGDYSTVSTGVLTIETDVKQNRERQTAKKIVLEIFPTGLRYMFR